MGRDGSAVASPERSGSPGDRLGYERLEGGVPVLYAPHLADLARKVRGYLAQGSGALAEILEIEPPGLTAFVVADEDWREAPREDARPYPPGLPYFTRSTNPPALVLPGELSPVFEPRTEATLPLTAWHELAHAFLLRGEVVRTPAWMRELVPQAASAAVARRAGLPLGEHLARIDRDPGFTVRGFRGRVGAGDQMSFQNLLLLLGSAALEQFGEGFLKRLVRALWREKDVVGEERAEDLLTNALGEDGRAWLESRPEF